MVKRKSNPWLVCLAISFGLAFWMVTSKKQVVQAKTIQPANPNASEETKQVLNYLNSLPDRSDNRVISGQHLSYDLTETSSGYQHNVADLYSLTNKWLAMIGVTNGLGATRAQISETNKLLIDYWNKGGLINFDHHANNPWTGGSSWDLTSRNLSELITSGTAVNKAWLAELDKVAVGFSELQNAGVVVLWRPFHEMNYREAFWWDLGASGGDPQPYIAAWKQMFNYLTYQKGLNNLIWVFSPANTNPQWNDILEAYPGDQYVDIISLDLYSDSITISGDNYSKLISKGKPVGFSEVGPGSQVSGFFDNTTIINSIRSRYPKMSFFQAWHSWTGNKMSLVDNQNSAGLLGDPWVITRDKVDWRSAVSPIPTQGPTSSPTLPPVGKVGDLNSDGRVDIRDLVIVGANFGTTSSQADVNHDGLVNIADLVLVGSNFGR